MIYTLISYMKNKPLWYLNKSFYLSVGLQFSVNIPSINPH
jgi:hypothetical protein